MIQEYNIERTVPLLLSTSQIDNRTTHVGIGYNDIIENSVGVIARGRTEVIWKLDLKELLGDLYDKHEFF